MVPLTVKQTQKQTKTQTTTQNLPDNFRASAKHTHHVNISASQGSE